MIYSYIFIGLYCARNLLEFLIKPGKKGKPCRGEKKGSVSLCFLIGGHIGSGASVSYALYLYSYDSLLLYVIGIVVFAMSFLGRIVAVKELGPNYSQYIECNDRGFLVTTGAYSKIRHPLYLFYILEMVGFIVTKYNIVSLLALGIVIITTLHRITAEEKALLYRFGDEFEKYRQKTKKLIPFLL